jgi:hypothetical protein
MTFLRQNDRDVFADAGAGIVLIVIPGEPRDRAAREGNPGG